MLVENWNVNLFEKLIETSSLVGLTDYFRILKDNKLILLFVYTNSVPY